MKLVYLLYTLYKTDYKKIWDYSQFVSRKQKVSLVAVVYDMLRCFFKFNTLFLDYFYFKFYEKSDHEKETYLDTLFMYRFQSKLNDKECINFFKDKLLFYDRFSDFISHKHLQLTGDFKPALANWIKKNSIRKVILKHSRGQAGKGIFFADVEIVKDEIRFNQKSLESFTKFLKQKRIDLIEEYIEQHSVLNKINSESLNTIRITTVRREGEVDIIGTILRMGAGKVVDNFDSGGVSAKIDHQTGVVLGPVIYKDPRIECDPDIHSITKYKVVGVKIPFWEEVLEMVSRAAVIIPEVKTVGWDVAIKNDGVFLLEGNHNWDKTHWQLCYQKGLKGYLEQFIS